jgi:hypothetical protein
LSIYPLSITVADEAARVARSNAGSYRDRFRGRSSTGSEHAFVAPTGWLAVVAEVTECARLEALHRRAVVVESLEAFGRELEQG